MKYLKCLFLFFSVSLFADPFLGEVIDRDLDVAYSYYRDDWTMGLSDGSAWKLLPLKEKRQKNWVEWWNQTEPKEWELSDEFFFDPRDWRGKYTIQVYLAKDSIASGFDYILVNENTQQKVFAKFIPHGSDIIPKVDYAKRITENVEPVSTSILASYILTDNVLVLENKSIWKLFPIDTNQRSFTEWWNGIEIDQPDEIFIYEFRDWKISDKIEIYRAHFDDSELSEKYKAKATHCEIYLLENKTRQKFAYAWDMPLGDLLEALNNNGWSQWQTGYSEGYFQGYYHGQSACPPCHPWDH